MTAKKHQSKPKAKAKAKAEAKPKKEKQVMTDPEYIEGNVWADSETGKFAVSYNDAPPPSEAFIYKTQEDAEVAAANAEGKTGRSGDAQRSLQSAAKDAGQPWDEQEIERRNKTIAESCSGYNPNLKTGSVDEQRPKTEDGEEEEEEEEVTPH